MDNKRGVSHASRLMWTVIDVEGRRGTNVDPSVPCQKDIDCSLFSKDEKNSTCLRGFCACENEQGQMKNCSRLQLASSQQEKPAVSPIYHTCKHEIDCKLNNSFCNTSRSQCECVKGYVSSADQQQCLRVAKSLNSSCTEDKQCLIFQENTTCQGQRCVCVDGYHAVEDVCWKTIVFGDTCSKSEECYHIKGAFCTDKKVCGCKEKAAIDKTGKNCVPYVDDIDEHCTENGTCSMIPDSICLENRCQCPKEKHFVKEIGQCIVSRAIGEPCQHDYDCYQSENYTDLERKGFVCVGSLCDCAVDYFINGDKCISAGVLTSFDFSSLVAIVLSIIGSIRDHREKEETRMRRSEGGTRKKRWCSPVPIRAPGLAAALPVVFLCFFARTSVVLAHGQHQHLLQRQNVLFAVRFGCAIVKEVELSKQQEGEDGADGPFGKGRRRGGGIRNVSRMVIGLSRILVLVPVTVCATISLPLEDYPRCNDRRSPPQTLAACRYDSDCMENAYCWNQEACYCKDGYVVYRNRSDFHCLKVADNIEDPCVANVQCHLTFTLHSECRNHVCQCSSTAHFVNGRCYESIGLGRMCQTNNNCYVKDSYCVGGYCVCDHSQHSNPERTQCVKNAYLGDKCEQDYECVSKSTRCMEVCRCKVDYVLSEDGTRCLKAANSVGEDCQENLQCQEFLRNAVCQNNVCTCIEDYHRRGPVCVRDVGLGQRCASHNECVTRTYKNSNSSELMNVDCSNGTYFNNVYYDAIETSFEIVCLSTTHSLFRFLRSLYLCQGLHNVARIGRLHSIQRKWCQRSASLWNLLADDIRKRVSLDIAKDYGIVKYH
ncbi:prion-like-(Q/N-rich) domain-bearing protein 25 isoform X2, partial [Vespula squamosa]